MKLTTNFSLEEFTFSRTALMLGIDNTPPPEIIENLWDLAIAMENVRTLLHSPITITSGYRCPKLNAHKAIGGSKHSLHMAGRACDFIAPRFGTPYGIAREIEHSGILFEELILEYHAWVHIAIPPNPYGIGAGKVLTYTVKGQPPLPGIIPPSPVA